jgi:hypothetical protein
MDSISGPELSLKVHAFRGTVKGSGTKVSRQVGWHLACSLACSLAGIALLAGCPPDPRDVTGAIGIAAQAASRDDPGALYDAIDERARHALEGIVKARREARQVVERAYPPAQRSEAISNLGDAAHAEDGRDLFRKRCDRACLDRLTAQLAAPKAVQQEGEVHVVHTVRGGELRLYRTPDGRYGILWNTQALARERSRAYAELSIIEANAEQYTRKQALK